MNHGSLFSGIGGFDIAAEWMGWENIFHCEWNKFGQSVLKYYWPKAISYDDITKTDFTIHRGQVDILTGGFPCQPYSVAGKRKGKEDERHLWPEMLRCIRECRPTWIVGENVSGLISWNGGLVFEEVCADLESEGYEVQPVILPACAVNAPHRRDRVWIVAHRSNARIEGLHEQKIGSDQLLAPTNAASTGRKEWEQRSRNTDTTENKTRLDDRPKRSGSDGNATNAENKGLQGCKDNGITKGIRKNRNKQLAGCIPPNWEMFPTQSPVRSRNDGVSSELDGITFPKWRNESIKAGGNAIVPHLAFEIFKVIEKMQNK